MTLRVLSILILVTVCGGMYCDNNSNYYKDDGWYCHFGDAIYCYLGQAINYTECSDGCINGVCADRRIPPGNYDGPALLGLIFGVIFVPLSIAVVGILIIRYINRKRRIAAHNATLPTVTQPVAS